MNVFLMNDTSSGHAGMRAVMRSIRKNLSGHKIVATHRVGQTGYFLPECEAVVVNGEGTIHHDAPCGRFLLQTLGKAQERGIKTFLVNAVFQQTPPYFSRVLERLDYLSVREPLSAHCARESGGRPVIAVDSAADRRFLQGRNLGKLAEVVCSEAPFVKVDLSGYDCFPLNSDYADIVETLRANGTIYITGLHHGVYAAGLAGVPFVPLPSNSWKIESLLAWFKADTGNGIPLRRTREEVALGVSFAGNNRPLFTEFHHWLTAKPIWEGLDN